MRYRRCKGSRSALLALVLSSVLSGAAFAQQKQNFDIPAEAAPAAIQRWAQQSGLQVFAAEDDLRGIRTNRVHGDFGAVEAAQMLVAGTGLEVIASAENTITIRRARPAVAPNGGDEKFSSAASESLMEVIVTGSRIKRPNYDTLQSVTVTDAAEMDRRAYTNIGQALEATPGFMESESTTIGTSQNNQGAGQTFVNFFGLGSSRTLTLLNGRRFVSSNSASARGNVPGSQVDMNVLPAGLVERVETVAIGGAPVYGSDAIAGTVNVILRDDFEGIEGSAVYGLTERDDARTETYRLLMGGNIGAGRGNAVLAVEYNEQAGLLLSERLGLGSLEDNPNNIDDTDGIPALLAVNNLHIGVLTDGGLPLDASVPGFNIPGISFEPLGLYPNGNWIFDASGNPLQFGADGNLAPYRRGSEVLSVLGAPVLMDGGDGLNGARVTPLLAPTKRTLINAIAHYDVTPWARAFTELSFAHTEGVEQTELIALAAPGIFGGPELLFSTSNPFLSQQSRDIFAANGLTQFQLNRNFNDILDREPGTTQIDLYRIVGGFEGDFGGFGGETYSWDIAFNYGRSHNESSLNFMNRDRLLEAIDAVVDPDTGQIVCASGNPACAPLNLFGENNFSDAAADYVTDLSRGVSINTMQMVTANLTGRLPFGISDPIAFNFGLEHRREAASFDPDQLQESGELLSGSGFGFAGVSGQFETDEAYTELVVPVISPAQNLPVVKSLTLEGAVRYVDHSITGGATTWSSGLRIAPRLPGWGDGLLFRGVYTRAIRSPAVTELFVGATPVATGISDICNADNFDEGLNPQVRSANCAAALAAVGAGSPETFSETTDVASVVGFKSGNLDLDNEEADSWSVGIVYQPVALPQLRFAADWSDITVDGGIRDLSLDELLTACYDSPDYPNVPACGAFQRLTAAEAAAQPGAPRVAGDVANGFRTGYINASTIEFSGMILEAAYGFNLPGAAGAMRFGTKWFYMDEFRITIFAGVPAANSAGLTAAPRNRANFDIGYSWRQLDLGVQARWIDSAVFSREDTIEDRPYNEMPSYTLFNGSVGYHLTEKVSLQLSVNNLFDKEMPYQARIANSVGTYDAIGRRYFATVRASF